MFYCGGGLQAWQPQDVPFEEHAIFYPHCIYVQYVKGRAFIRDCQKLFQEREMKSVHYRMLL